MKRLLPLALLAAALAGCNRTSRDKRDGGDDGDKPLPKVERPALADKAPDADVRAVASANNAFALDLLSQLDGDNVFFSPVSVSTALSMTYAGARGDTAKEMSKALHYPFEGERLHHGYAGLLGKLTGDGKPAGVQLSVANALWGRDEYQKDFLTINRDCYAATVRKIDLVGAEPVINKWAEDNTAGLIKNYLPPDTLTERHRLVLTNAVYFKGQWKDPFKKAATADEPFRLKDGKKVQVKMMHRTGDYPVGRLDPNGPGAALVLTLPYKGNELSMVVILPNAVDGLAKTEKALTAGKLDTLRNAHGREVRVSLPRFKIDGWAARLNDSLKALGMQKAFDPDQADFSGMIGDVKTHLDEVRHKAFVEVNEEGSEAAAVTDAKDKDKGPPPPPPIDFVADHPFLFLIRDERTGCILFLGRYGKPS
jgi:serpin B